ALGDVSNGKLIARDDSGTGLVDPSGKVLVPLLYDGVSPVDQGLVKVTRGNRFAYVRLSDGKYLWKEDGFLLPSSN
nr:WG repeat-containing protein [Flavobacteriales bacterium]